MTTYKNPVTKTCVMTHPLTYWNRQHLDDEKEALESLIRLIGESALMIGCGETFFDRERREILMGGMYTLFRSLVTHQYHQGVYPEEFGEGDT